MIAKGVVLIDCKGILCWKQQPQNSKGIHRDSINNQWYAKKYWWSIKHCRMVHRIFSWHREWSLGPKRLSNTELKAYIITVLWKVSERIIQIPAFISSLWFLYWKVMGTYCIMISISLQQCCKMLQYHIGERDEWLLMVRVPALCTV